MMQSEGTVLSKSVRQRSSMKKLNSLSASASVEGTTGQTNLESGKPTKNALSGIVSSRDGTGQHLESFYMSSIHACVGSQSTRYNQTAGSYHKGTRLHCLRVQSKKV